MTKSKPHATISQGENMENLYSQSELAELTGVSRQNVNLWVKAGHIKPAQTAGKKITLFDKTAIEIIKQKKLGKFKNQD